MAQGARILRKSLKSTIFATFMKNSNNLSIIEENNEYNLNNNENSKKKKQKQ